MTVKDFEIAVSLNGTLVVASGSLDRYLIRCEEPGVVEAVKRNIERPTRTFLNSKYTNILYPTGKNSLLEFVAAIVAVDPGNALVLKAPEDVLQQIQEPLKILSAKS